MKNSTELELIDNIHSNCLFSSDFYEVKNWSFDLIGKKMTNGYNDCFCIVFVKNGSFRFDLAFKTHETHIGHIIIEKSNYEYRLRPSAGECSIFNFTDAFYNQIIHDCALDKAFFFSNPNILSILINSSPEIDYLHHQVMTQLFVAGKLEMDSLVLELSQQVIESITDKPFDFEIPPSLVKNHYVTIERAKEYMNGNFANDISLKELAAYCNISPFHFSRTFKQFTSYSPHQYLLNFRLKHAEMLLRMTTKPIADICFSSGFNSLEHFATIFKQKYRLNPTQYRKRK